METADRGIAESGSSWLSTLMIDITGHLVWDLLHDRHTWRSGVRSAMRAASHLSGRGPTGVDVVPVPAH